MLPCIALCSQAIVSSLSRGIHLIMNVVAVLFFSYIMFTAFGLNVSYCCS